MSQLDRYMVQFSAHANIVTALPCLLTKDCLWGAA